MTPLILQIDIRAPIERCFNLARSMDFHTHSMRSTGERVRYWRHVPVDPSAEILVDDLPILRVIDPTNSTALSSLEGTPLDDLWNRAAGSVISAVTFEYTVPLFASTR